ncbi:MAG: hypothetical protein HQL96_09615 [Magnetococcales bacterium]|nr:hypothetical protein [Magnetococcales bacterium]
MDERKSPAGGPGGGKWTQNNCTSSDGRAQGSFDVDRVRELAKGRWDGILPAMGLDPACLTGRHGPCPFCGGKDRWRFDDRGGSGSGICAQCGGYSDGFALVAKVRGIDPVRDFPEIVKLVAEADGAQPETDITPRSRGAARPVPARPTPQPGNDNQTRARLLATWRASIPLDHPDAELGRRYLEWRGLGAILADLPGPDVMRFTPALSFWRDGRAVEKFPALLALVRGPGGGAVSIHRSYLAADGRGKAPVPDPKN